MTKIGLFYGTDTGSTERVAETIQSKLGEDCVELYNVASDNLSEMLQYDTLILGIPTWYDGELQGDWESVFDELDDLDLSGKTMALFGLGDQVDYDCYFLDAMGILADKVEECGAKVVGRWPTQGYSLRESKAERGAYFVGLAIDEDNEAELTEERIDAWLEQIKSEFGELETAGAHS